MDVHKSTYALNMSEHANPMYTLQALVGHSLVPRLPSEWTREKEEGRKGEGKKREKRGGISKLKIPPDKFNT